MVLKIDKEDAEPVGLTLAPIWSPSKGGFPWLIVTVILAVPSHWPLIVSPP